MTIADRLAVFMEGRIVQVGTPDEVFDRPANVAVAGFIGSPPMNLMGAQVRDGSLAVDGIPVPLDRPAGPDGDVTLGVRPGAVRLAASGLPARVELVENLGDTTIVDVEAGDRLVKIRSEGRPDVREGDSVHLAFAPRSIHLFDATTGDRR
jgi:multiple sugar transport system ATP-binding protein